ncbi:MAG TPA: glycosyltransferase family 39 protein [Acidimicrobiales bacterium]|nr:glycosyltransferase family 39 protein [Acidimicrobiales bacterium]
MITDVQTGGVRVGAWAVSRSDLSTVLVVAAGVLVFHAALSGRYGFHRDELYYLAAGRHPALGYVDQPPLVPLLARAIAAVAGNHLWPLRLAAGAVHAAVVILAAVIARELGGGGRAMALSALATAMAPLFLATGGMFQTAVFDQLWWALAILMVVRLLADRADPRWWLAVGVAIGVGLETKWTMALLGLGLAAGFVATPAGRRHLRSPWLAAGVAVALALWLPNLVWQGLNGWPTVEFSRNNNASVRDEDGRLGFLLQQIALVGPLALPLAAGGLVWLWRRSPWRILAVAVAAIALVLLVVGGKAYYLGPTYVLALAAGGVAAERWAGPDPGRWHTLIGALVLNGLIPLAAVAPVAPIDTYAAAFHDLNDELAEQVGWPEMVDQVARVATVLPADEQAGLRVITASYGEAAAIDLYGPARGLPRGTALSAHNSYADWWPDDGSPRGAVIFVRYPRVTVERYCDALGPVAIVSNPWDAPNEVAGAPMLVCHRLRVSPESLRDSLRHYE